MCYVWTRLWEELSPLISLRPLLSSSFWQEPAIWKTFLSSSSSSSAGSWICLKDPICGRRAIRFAFWFESEKLCSQFARVGEEISDEALATSLEKVEPVSATKELPGIQSKQTYRCLPGEMRQNAR